MSISLEKADMHYVGFVDACMQLGIEKSAACRLYKEAQGVPRAAGMLERIFGRLARTLGTNVNRAERFGHWSKGFLEDLGAATKRNLGKAYNFFAEPIGINARRAYEAIGRANREFARQYGAVREELHPGFLEAAREAARERDLAKALSLSPWKWTKNFVKSHPLEIERMAL